MSAAPRRSEPQRARPSSTSRRRRHQRPKLFHRFWSKVERRALHQCWLWTGATSTGSLGYGTFSVEGRTQYAHRVAYELTHDPIPKGMLVLHHCDRPGCVNPRHLTLGTHLDNARHATERGRFNRKLTPAAVRSIFEARARGEARAKELAELHGVTPATIQRVFNGKSWRPLTTPGPLKPPTWLQSKSDQ